MRAAVVIAPGILKIAIFGTLNAHEKDITPSEDICDQKLWIQDVTCKLPFCRSNNLFDGTFLRKIEIKMQSSRVP